MFRWHVWVFAFGIVSSIVSASDWPQGGGPTGDFQVPDSAPTSWSVIRGEQIAWRNELPETGQSPVVVADGRAFFSHYVSVSEEVKVGTDIVACCVDAATGQPRWQRVIAGQHPLRLSGCFSDSTSPPAVISNDRVIFINASGTIACFSLDGEPIWSRAILTAGRTIPFLHEGNVVFIRQIYPPDETGNFTHEHEHAQKQEWTQLQALDIDTGEIAWTSECGVNMGCLPLPQQRSDGIWVALVGRGGGHGPPERPEGVSMVSLADGHTLWSLPLEGFMSTMSFGLFENQAVVYHRGECLLVDAFSGVINHRIDMLNDIPARLHEGDHWTDARISIPEGKAGREITQGSNLRVGDFSFFRSYQRNLLGRINLRSHQVEYLMLPVQVLRERDQPDRALWSAEGSIPSFKSSAKPRPLQLNEWALRHNEVRNARGLRVMGDDRSQGNGWGHIASPSPIAAGQHLYVTTMSGLVYVLRWKAERWDEKALVAINDLGPLGTAWTRASLSCAGGRLYAHTIDAVIAIGP
ncbi:MAG: PQQ-binding-like beta-propeller repeat protein [Verrucomicrobiales bacterium]|nr:PQQ-binding-like beta-propeller repeat protein [Verrucomicrobiales bacterium]